MSKKRILILSPHTDDAELGCGGFILKSIEEGHDILWVVFSTAEESLPEHLPSDTLVTEFKSVIDFVGLNEENYIINRFKVRKLHEYRQDILELLVKIRKDFKPTHVVGTSVNDVHQDHQVVTNEMIRAFKMSATILCYELPWNHLNFNTQCFVPLDEGHVEKKIEILNLYRSQFIVKRNYFSADFVRGLAFTRGAQIGSKYAEAFEVIRWII
jgi:LmbE family N-acetylglucosaminyl deacetylase